MWREFREVVLTMGSGAAVVFLVFALVAPDLAMAGADRLADMLGAML